MDERARSGQGEPRTLLKQEQHQKANKKNPVMKREFKGANKCNGCLRSWRIWKERKTKEGWYTD